MSQGSLQGFWKTGIQHWFHGFQISRIQHQGRPSDAEELYDTVYGTCSSYESDTYRSSSTANPNSFFRSSRFPWCPQTLWLFLWQGQQLTACHGTAGIWLWLQISQVLNWHSDFRNEMETMCCGTGSFLNQKTLSKDYQCALKYPAKLGLGNWLASLYWTRGLVECHLLSTP